MTEIKIFKEENHIGKIVLSGHALYARHGKDLVCAGISSVITGICNALDELTDYDSEQITIDDGYVEIPNLTNNGQVQLICEVLIVQLKTIETVYPKYIEISYS
jgi:uncharacterized protein